MANIFFISDTHFGHEAMLRFTTDDGHPCRIFPSVDAMDEHIIERWNSVVKPPDHVYHLGDVAMKWRFIEKVARCNGHKRLIRGNHDIFPTKKYLPFFEEIYSMRIFNRHVESKEFGSMVQDGLIFTHIPIHPESLKPYWTNVHGHVHNNVPQGHFGKQYYNVSVEEINYTPIALEDLRTRIYANNQ